MKDHWIKLLVAGIGIIAPTCMTHAGNSYDKKKNRSGQTYMLTRPIYHNSLAAWAGWDKFIACKRCNHPTNIKITGMYQESHSWDKAAGYFLVDCKPTLTVAAGNTTSTRSHDVRAEWFNLAFTNDQKETISLNPYQKRYGINLTINKCLQDILPIPFFDQLWTELNVPIVKTHTNLQATTSQPEILANLNHTLRYAQLTNTPDKKSGIPEIQLTFGNTYVHHNGFLLAYYSGLGIPTESSPQQKRLFPATLGNNKHLVVLAGINARLPLFYCYDDTVRGQLFFHAKNHHYIPNHQARTIPLKDKPWSQYLLVRRQGDSATIPAANVLTRHVKVSPHSFADINTGLLLSTPYITLHAAYGLWAHHDEQIELRTQQCDTVPVTMHQYGIAGTGTNSASHSTIATQADDDANFTTLKDTDLDLGKAGGRGIASHRFNLMLSYTNEDHPDSFLAEIGGWYEVPHSNTHLKTWGIWGSIMKNF